MAKRWLMRVGDCVIAGTDSDVFLHGFPKPETTASQVDAQATSQGNSKEAKESNMHRKGKGGG
jgi:hypothetical protein